MMEGTYVSQTLALVSRELKHWYRSKTQILTVVIQPMIWLVLFGKAMSGYIHSAAPGVDYFTFLALGMMIITVLFSSMNAGMTLIWDRRFGFLDKLRAAPVPRGVIPLSRVLAAMVKAVVQAILVLIVALLLGLDTNGLTAASAVVCVITILICAACISLTVSSVFVAMGLVIRNQEVLTGVTVLLNLPIMFASGAMFPTSTFPDWLRFIANGNPLTYATDAIRQAWGGMDQMISVPNVGLPESVLIVVVVAFLVTAGGMFFARRALRGD